MAGQEIELRKLTIVIAGRSFPVKVTKEEALILPTLEKSLNDQIRQIQLSYVDRDIQDCLSMVLLTQAIATHNEDAFGNTVLQCERPDYREIHTIGAIQGHHIYALTMLAVRALRIDSELDRSDFMYKIVVRIMRRLNKNYKNIPLQGLGRIYHVFQDVMNQALNKSSLNQTSKRELKTA